MYKRQIHTTEIKMVNQISNIDSFIESRFPERITNLQFKPGIEISSYLMIWLVKHQSILKTWCLIVNWWKSHFNWTKLITMMFWRRAISRNLSLIHLILQDFGLKWDRRIANQAKKKWMEKLKYKLMYFQLLLLKRTLLERQERIQITLQPCQSLRVESNGHSILLRCGSKC